MLFWCFLCSCKEREKCCKFRNVKGRLSVYGNEKAYPCQPPYPSPQETERLLKDDPGSLRLAISTIEEDLSFSDACAVCLFGYV